MVEGKEGEEEKSKLAFSFKIFPTSEEFGLLREEMDPSKFQLPSFPFPHVVSKQEKILPTMDYFTCVSL